MSHKFEAVLYAILFTFWCVRLYYKLYNKKTRRYILSMGILIVFWMIIRMCKGVIDNNFLERMCWYLYYLSLIFIPTIFYICVNDMTHKRKIIMYFISSILFLLVLTNDLHFIVFKFLNGIQDYDAYKHNIGYYLIAIWIFYLFGSSMIKLVIKRLKTKKDIKALLPLVVLIMSITYTVLYVINIGIIRDIDMSIMNSIFICLGIELMFYLDLIPNNKKYIKAFMNSNLNMITMSLDTKIIYNTKSFSKIPSFILKDIKNNKIKDIYVDKNIQYKVLTNNDSYVIFKNDLTIFNNFKKEVSNKQKQLLKLQNNIKKNEQSKRKLYEINLRRDVVAKIEKTLDEKRLEAKKLLNKKDITNEDYNKIKRIIIYSKKKSSIMISDLNDEKFNENSIKIILDELIKSMNSLNIDGLTIVKNKMIIDGNIMNIIYDVIYEILDNIKNSNVIIYISYDKYITIKINISNKFNIKDKLKLDKNIHIKQNIYSCDTELIIELGGEDK